MMQKAHAERLTTSLLENLPRLWWGFRPSLVPDIVAERGSWGAVKWFVKTMPRFQWSLTVDGPLRTQLLCTAISMLNSCPYCTYGHAYAFQLHYFRLRGRLFPADEQDMLAWQRDGEETVTERLREALWKADLALEIPVFERLLELRGGAAPETAEDRRIQHLLSMLGILNACALRNPPALDEAHDPINRDVALKRRYAEARREDDRGAPHASSSPATPIH